MGTLLFIGMATAHRHHKMPPSKRPGATVDVNSLMRRLRIQVEDSNARIKEHFQEYDKLRRGTISQTKFQIACTSAKFVLNGAEYDALFELFAVQGAANSDMVNYKDFTEFLDGDRN